MFFLAFADVAVGEFSWQRQFLSHRVVKNREGKKMHMVRVKYDRISYFVTFSFCVRDGETGTSGMRKFSECVQHKKV